MAATDPDEERRRLTEFYSKQTDGELASVAEQWYQLTDIAREILRAELVKRGLYQGQLDHVSARAEERTQFRDLVTVRTYLSLPEAELAKGLLDAAGIESFLFDNNTGRMYMTNIVGGVRLRVDADNAEEANRILQESTSGEAALEDDFQPPDDNPSA